MYYILNNIWLILFVAWGLPLGFYRSKFRKIVYQTDNWVINIKPFFWKELRGLFGNIYPENIQYRKFRNFYLFYLAIYTILFISYLSFHNNTNDMEKISVGSTIPSFALHDQHGQLFQIDSVVGKKNLVIYFYPKDDTPGCTKEACAFRDQYEDFEEADALIIGISGQSVESHLNFANKHRLNLTLLSDEGNKVRKMFGVPTNLFGLIAGRVTYVVNKKGEVVYMFNSQTEATRHVEESIRILREMK